MPGYADDKTEPPTPRRRQEARRRGQVARSADLTAAAPLLAGFAALAVLGPGLWQTMLALTKEGLSSNSSSDLQDMGLLLGRMLLESCKWLGPFLLIVGLTIVGTLLAQVGFLLTAQPLMPSLNKINPLNGLRRLFSLRAAMFAAVNVAKLVVVGLVATLTLYGSADAVLYMLSLGSQEAVAAGAKLMFQLGIRLSAVLLLFALVDYAWQRYRHEQDLRMTKEEVKDELRSMEGDPLLRRRRREVQLQLAMQRLRKEVPKADVVVTNPTHVSVAIGYGPATMIAPKVLAKGADVIAIRIRQLAREFGIPIVQRPPLARALYESVNVGGYVPERLYQAIAEILAYVYTLTGRRPATSGKAGARAKARSRSWR